MITDIKEMFSMRSKTIFSSWLNQASLAQKIPFIIALSWVFAMGAQIIIPLPFNLVPLALNPFPLFLAVRFFGIHAVYSYLIYIIEGLLGFPVFISFKSGPAYLFGPTGGYTLGFFIAMFFLAQTHKYTKNSFVKNVFVLFSCMIIYFGTGLLQLSFFVKNSDLFLSGLYPFIIGDTCKMIVIMILFS